MSGVFFAIFFAVVDILYETMMCRRRKEDQLYDWWVVVAGERGYDDDVIHSTVVIHTLKEKTSTARSVVN